MYISQKQFIKGQLNALNILQKSLKCSFKLNYSFNKSSTFQKKLNLVHVTRISQANFQSTHISSVIKPIFVNEHICQGKNYSPIKSFSKDIFFFISQNLKIKHLKMFCARNRLIMQFIVSDFLPFFYFFLKNLYKNTACKMEKFIKDVTVREGLL